MWSLKFHANMLFVRFARSPALWSTTKSWSDSSLVDISLNVNWHLGIAEYSWSVHHFTKPALVLLLMSLSIVAVLVLWDSRYLKLSTWYKGLLSIWGTWRKPLVMPEKLQCSFLPAHPKPPSFQCIAPCSMTILSFICCFRNGLCRLHIIIIMST